MVTVMLGCALLDELPHSHVLEDGAHVVELDMRDDLRGPAGSLGGGLIAVLVDCAGASALASAGDRRPVATSHTSIDYLAAALVTASYLGGARFVRTVE